MTGNDRRADAVSRRPAMTLMPDIRSGAAAAPEPAGAAMMRLIAELYPICRSITGEGLRQTLRIVQRAIPIELREVPSGTQVFDWTIPREWNVSAGWIETLDGTRIVDFARHSLHLLNYSVAIDRVVPIEELRRHLFTLPEQPDLIPYRTSYYAENWGFCLSQRQADSLTEAAYRVRIDTTLEPGSLSYGELVLPGESEDEFLFSCHSCHPSLANDNLSGIAVAAMLARRLMARGKRRLTYRFLFIPGTIGSLAWLAANEAVVPKVRHGLVLTCLGDQGPSTYKQSRRGDAAIDRIVAHVLRQGAAEHRILPFVPYGYDERQYCSPGFDMPVGCLMRSPNGTFPEYHTSADNLDFVRAESLEDSLAKLERIVAIAEGDGLYRSLSPKGEPQLGKRGLYRPMGGSQEAGGGYDQMTLLWVLNLADGKHSLLDMAERAGIPFADIRAAADALIEKGLLAPA
jgi:aminopeptidase-like protein